jgi:hypothetical protein
MAEREGGVKGSGDSIAGVSEPSRPHRRAAERGENSLINSQFSQQQQQQQTLDTATFIDRHHLLRLGLIPSADSWLKITGFDLANPTIKHSDSSRDPSLLLSLLHLTSSSPLVSRLCRIASRFLLLLVVLTYQPTSS